MDDELKSALKSAILMSSQIVREQLENYTQPYLIWRKHTNGGWYGKYQDRPDLHKTFNVTRGQLNEAASAFAGLFMAKYPEYSGPVGVTDLRHDRVLIYVTRIPESALRWFWYTQGSLDVDDATIDAVVTDFVESIERPTIQLRFQGQLLNYHMDADRLVLPNDLVIRRLSEDEVSALDGGPLVRLGFMRSRFGGPHEYIMEGEVEVAKQDRKLESFVNNIARDHFNKAILCLRTFKAGHIGYDYIHFRSVKFCQFSMGSRGCGDSYVPFGSYRISKEEETPLQDYAAMFFRTSEPAMEMACSRLADAETRTRPQDRFVDAVIGMEAVLLAGLKKEDRRGELRYRFSVHYSTLFSSPKERYHAFRVARDLYDLRSTIAHGSEMKDEWYRVGQEKLKLANAAMRASEALRTIVCRFLPETDTAPYKTQTFWDKAYFGLGEDGGKGGHH
jgi:hypothetical protein